MASPTTTTTTTSDPNDVFQFSTYSALHAGFTESPLLTAELITHGTDGIGVYEDGRLLILKDSLAHALRKDGATEPAPMRTHLCFAMVSTFQPPFRAKIPLLTLEGLDALLSSSEFGPAKGVNSLMPFKITGDFETVELNWGTKHNVSGSLVGFVVPNWMKAISGPRIHTHFLDANDEYGGRVIEFKMGVDATLRFAKAGEFRLRFPQGEEWENMRV